ncbi:MAG: DUF3179 domain-containing protein [Aureispira sp.]|nr:DUF3179 domain-containing protein [Aureispira sp.]
MALFIAYSLTFLAFAVLMAAGYMAVIETFPIRFLYYQYFIRKPLIWSIFLASITWLLVLIFQEQAFAWLIPSVLLNGLVTALSYKVHQEYIFKAIDFPKITDQLQGLPLTDQQEIALIEYNGVLKGYPLDYVIHHHIVNDYFGDKIVSLTYCAMCRSIIPFDVTDIGPLFVGSFKNANMIVADRKTKTFFQQSTFDSVIGKLHPHSLTMIPFQILPFAEVKALQPAPLMAAVTQEDLKPFELFVKGFWSKLTASEVTPGLFAKSKDQTFPARTPVIGIYQTDNIKELVYIKKSVLEQKIIINQEYGFILLALGSTVNCFNIILDNTPLALRLEDNNLIDSKSNTTWDIRGKWKSGSLQTELEPIAISDEYWFSWKKYHPNTLLVEL